MLQAKAFGDQHLDGLAEQFFPGEPQQQLDLAVNQDDPAPRIDHEKAAG
jgi:hypothetical protein